ncbi:MAG: AI-2E family transporter YdiK [Quisquiliibacterium sp.]
MQREVTRTLLAVLSIGALIIAAFWVLRPFLSSIIWASTLVIATWPVMIGVQRRFKGRRTPAIAVMMMLMLLLFVLPFWLAIGTVAENITKIGEWGALLQGWKVPPPPAFLEHVPMVGDKLLEVWTDAASGGWGPMAAKLQPYLVQVVRWLASEVGTVGVLLVQFLLTVLVAGVLYANGEQAALILRRFGRRLAGERGEHSVTIAGQAIRGVALGVVVTALVQSLLAGLGLGAASVPFASGLTIAALLLCIAQIGPLPVLIPAVAWIYLTGDNVVATLLLVWTVVVASLDNVLRPYLIRKGADLPLLLIFAGVIGGLLSFGLLGIFVGPVVLAVNYKLLDAWIREDVERTSSGS